MQTIGTKNGKSKIHFPFKLGHDFNKHFNKGCFDRKLSLILGQAEVDNIKKKPLKPRRFLTPRMNVCLRLQAENKHTPINCIVFNHFIFYYKEKPKQKIDT